MALPSAAPGRVLQKGRPTQLASQSLEPDHKARKRHLALESEFLGSLQQLRGPLWTLFIVDAGNTS